MGETSIAEADVAVDEEAQVEATALYLEDPDSIHVRDAIVREQRAHGRAGRPLAHDPWAEAN